MTSALVVEGSPPADVDLAADLAAAGVRVLGATPRGDLVREAVRTSPDVIVCHEVSPDETLFAAFALLAETAPCPVVVFTHDPEAAKIERALAAGIHSYVVNGYSARAAARRPPGRPLALRSTSAALRAELVEVTRRFDERKLVDRAKGILMRARQVSEEEAFAVLRAASMHSNQRVGQVSRQVIAAAHYADAVNRAGKLRMLSQRLVKACALRVLDRRRRRHADQVDDATRQIDANIAALAKSVSKPTFGDLLDAVAAAWPKLQALAAPALAAGGLAALDAAAERLLLQADKADPRPRDRRPGDDAARHQRLGPPAHAVAALCQGGAARPASLEGDAARAARAEPGANRRDLRAGARPPARDPAQHAARSAPCSTTPSGVWQDVAPGGAPGRRRRAARARSTPRAMPCSRSSSSSPTATSAACRC